MRIFKVGLTMLAVALVPQLKAASQKTTADLIEQVRPAVVQVYVVITDPPHPAQEPLPISQPLKDCFGWRRICVVGTGFFINDSGDVVTASHVADAVQQIIQLLGTNGIHARAGIGLSVPNSESTSLTSSSNGMGFFSTLLARDAEHDIAVFRPETNPFSNMPPFFGGSGASGLPQTKVTFVRLAIGRPSDGEEIFACGFPFGNSGLVTTSGAIASAWKTELLSTAKAAGSINSVDVYWVDLRVNPGNSGGPVFRMSDHAAIGMAVELKGSLEAVA
jgi:S1-C subfamily serine protease